MAFADLDIPSGSTTPTMKNPYPKAVARGVEDRSSRLLKTVFKPSTIIRTILNTETDYILLSAGTRCTHGDLFFWIIYQGTEGGSSTPLYVSYRTEGTPDVEHLNVDVQTMQALLKDWLSGISSVSVNFKIFQWPAEIIQGALASIYAFKEKVDGVTLQASDRTVSMIFSAADPYSIKAIDLRASNTPYLGIYGAPIFARLRCMTFTMIVTELECFSLFRFCAQAADMMFFNVVQEDIPEGKKPLVFSDSSAIELRHLKSLHVRIATFDVTTVLEPFTWPALQSLQLTIAPITEQTIERLKGFLNRRASDEPLRVLNIFDYTMESETAISLLLALLECRWGPRERCIATVGLYSSSLPKSLVKGFPAAWDAHKKGKRGLLNKLFTEHKNLPWGKVRQRARIGWGNVPFCYSFACE